MPAIDVSYTCQGNGPAIYLAHGIGARITELPVRLHER